MILSWHLGDLSAGNVWQEMFVGNCPGGGGGGFSGEIMLRGMYEIVCLGDFLKVLSRAECLVDMLWGIVQGSECLRKTFRRM